MHPPTESDAELVHHAVDVLNRCLKLTVFVFLNNGVVMDFQSTRTPAATVQMIVRMEEKLAYEHEHNLEHNPGNHPLADTVNITTHSD